jgi:hypothetical protein
MTKQKECQKPTPMLIEQSYKTQYKNAHTHQKPGEGQDSAVGMATRCGIGDPGIESRCG